jgi:hypothetical protein
MGEVGFITTEILPLKSDSNIIKYYVESDITNVTTEFCNLRSSTFLFFLVNHML